MQNFKVLKNKTIIMVPLLVMLLKANANTAGYNPDDIAKFENSNPHNCTQCDLYGWNMNNSSKFVYGGDYSYTNLSGAFLSSSHIFQNLSSGSPAVTNVQYSDFSDSNAENGNIGDSLTMNFSNSNFNNVSYISTVLEAKSFRGTTFKYATIKNSDIRTSDISATSFYHAILTGTTFHSVGAADLADFTGADLSNANINSLLSSCNFTQATFVTTNLQNATISTCDESGADFTGADLTQASITNGDLCNAKITPEQLSSMKSLTGTIAPDCKTIYK